LEKASRLERKAFILGWKGGIDQSSNPSNPHLYHELFQIAKRFDIGVGDYDS